MTSSASSLTKFSEKTSRSSWDTLPSVAPGGERVNFRDDPEVRENLQMCELKMIKNTCSETIKTIVETPYPGGE